MKSLGNSTENLHNFAADYSNGSGHSNRSKRVRPLSILIFVVIAVLVITGSVVGALIAKDVIHVSPQPATAETTSSTIAQGTSTTVPRASTTENNRATTTVVPQATACTSPDDIPSAVKGTWLDPSVWLDKKDFNCTFTDKTIGDLPIVGLNSTWDDSKQANPNVPPLNQPWGSYASRPIRGVSLGGWLSLEPFITPSLFESGFDSTIIDEYSLCAKLGPSDAAAKLEKHYSTFITEDDFRSIADAGLDHVRIPFSYWAVKTFDDPYVFGVSWRYLLRGIEWARKYGLRVKLDLHGVPGSQNGWNHSGRQGKIDWLNIGSDGRLNAQRTLDIHNQLSKFFAQDRYKNVVAFYGLINEPALALSQDDLISWTQQAVKIVKDNGVVATQVFSEAMRGLSPWTGKLQGYGNSLAIDVHLYSIFDDALVKLKHADRISLACNAWTSQLSAGMAGFGPTMVGEWSQADTDCTKYLNGVGNGARWTGTFSGNNSPKCPTGDRQCNCAMANADTSTFTSEYKLFLRTWAEAQMSVFEKSWGWFYWAWKTESAPLWSYQAGLQGDFMPAKAYQRTWTCSQPVPSFGSLPEFY